MTLKQCNFKTLSEEEFSLDVDYNSPISEIEHIIRTRLGRDVQLVWRGDILKSNQTLSSLGVSESNCLILLPRRKTNYQTIYDSLLIRLEEDFQNPQFLLIDGKHQAKIEDEDIGCLNQTYKSHLENWLNQKEDEYDANFNLQDNVIYMVQGKFTPMYENLLVRLQERLKDPQYEDVLGKERAKIEDDDIKSLNQTYKSYLEDWLKDNEDEYDAHFKLEDDIIYMFKKCHVEERVANAISECISNQLNRIFGVNVAQSTGPMVVRRRDGTMMHVTGGIRTTHTAPGPQRNLNSRQEGSNQNRSRKRPSSVQIESQEKKKKKEDDKDDD